MNEPERIVTIFGGSKCGDSDLEYFQALRVGELLAEAGFTICTGGYAGVMEAASRGAPRTLAAASSASQ
jgi:predicted Rossmann-fold nucleotide-binding protein